jgi:deoxyribonuclease-4
MTTRIGGHISTIGGVAASLIMIHRMGGSCVQITVGALDDRNSFITLEKDDITKVLNIRKKYNYYVVVHGKYIYNFCRAAWKWQEDSLFKELTIANDIGADVIIHQGKNLPELNLTDDEALAVFAEGVTRVAKRMREASLCNRILLENSARQGTELGYSIDQLARILALIPEELHMYFGVCIDTCHIFVAGGVDWGDPEGFFREFDQKIGLERLAVVHLNDSAIPFNGRNDKHAGIGKGLIARDNLEKVVNFCTTKSIPMILETPTEGLTREISWANNVRA